MAWVSKSWRRADQLLDVVVLSQLPVSWYWKMAVTTAFCFFYRSTALLSFWHSQFSWCLLIGYQVISFAYHHCTVSPTLFWLIGDANVLLVFGQHSCTFFQLLLCPLKSGLIFLGQMTSHCWPLWVKTVLFFMAFTPEIIWPVPAFTCFKVCSIASFCLSW